MYVGDFFVFLGCWSFVCETYLWFDGDIILFMSPLIYVIDRNDQRVQHPISTMLNRLFVISTRIIACRFGSSCGNFLLEKIEETIALYIWWICPRPSSGETSSVNVFDIHHGLSHPLPWPRATKPCY